MAKRCCALSGALLFLGLLQAEDSLRYTFSGTVTEVAPELSPRIATTFIFSGSLEFTDRQVVTMAATGDDYVEYENFITAAEFTFDENYVLVEEATLSKGESKAKIVDQSVTSDEPDMVNFLIPLEPPNMRLNDYNPVWLELFFFDDTRMMLNGTELPKRKLASTSAGFRVHYFNKETQVSVFVAGVLDDFHPQHEEQTAREAWLAMENIILELNSVILSQQQTIQKLELQLAAAEKEMASLRQALEAEQAAQVSGAEGEDAQPMINALQAKIAALTGAMEEIESKETQAQVIITQLNDERASLLSTNTTITQDLQNVSTSLVNLNREMEDRNKVIAALNRELSAKNNQLQTIQTELANALQTATEADIETNAAASPLGAPQQIVLVNNNTPTAKTGRIISKKWNKRYGPRRR